MLEWKLEICKIARRTSTAEPPVLGALLRSQLGGAWFGVVTLVLGITPAILGETVFTL